MMKRLSMFPFWPNDLVHDVRDDQTYCDPEAIPEQLRTRKRRDECHDCSFEDVEPITTLRRAYLGVYAEVVRISYWIGRKEDGSTFYQVNLVRPLNLGFARDQQGTVTLDYNLGAGFSEFEAVAVLLADAKRFIEWHRQECQ
jgi:hypothetical protein